MKRYNFNKLIRSNLPERMKKEGVYLSGRSLTDEEFAKELKNKLVEEAGEVQDTQSREDLIKELADVMEVIETLTSLRGITKEEIEKERLLKCQINGHFLAANFVDYIEVPITNRKVIEYLQKRNRPYECN
ncbi:MAG: nucleoside triphosphate pyrophosphohydrolase [Rickettsiaceae bacterium]|nr:nucleoside triphosphate pyrophosphohydrolase [Rickettsiaceae bacterium]MCP5378704.1 nucleoside triphosphate pyrophosphohydrolase [Rickettsiaceae bacterium]